MTNVPSRLVQGLAERLGELTGKRVMVEVLLDHAHMIDPGLVGDPAGSARFRAALDELLADGLLTFPPTAPGPAGTAESSRRSPGG